MAKTGPTKAVIPEKILMPVDLSGKDLPAERLQMMIDTAVEKIGKGSYTLWSHETPNISSLDMKWIQGGLQPREDIGAGEASPWEGMYELKYDGDTFFMIGAFVLSDYKFIKAYAIVGPSKEKVLALNVSLSKALFSNKRAMAPKYIFTPRNGRTPRPSYDWDKVILPEDIRKSLQTNFTTFFKGPEAFKKAGVAYRRGILLTGAPGTGKTSILKAVMSQYKDVPFFVFERTFDDVYVEDLRSLYAEASKMQPAVVVIEDIDRLVDTNSFPLADLLNVLDGLGSAQGVMTIATANNEGDIDPALVERPSRFDLVIRVPLPDKEHRKGYIQERSKSLDITLEVEQLDKLLAGTSEFSMAMLQELFTGAVLTAFAEDTTTSFEHLEKSLKSIDGSLKVARKQDTKKKKAGFSGVFED